MHQRDVVKHPVVAGVLALIELLSWLTTTGAAVAAQAGADDELASLLVRVDLALSKVQARQLNSREHTPWVVMHAVIAFENDVEVFDVDANTKLGAVEYLCGHARYDGLRIFRDQGGEPALPTRGLHYGLKKSFRVQDHVDQYLMAFADAHVPLDTPILAEGGRKFRVGDLLTAAKLDFRKDQELGWTLVATSTYVPAGESWTARSGKAYRVEDIVALAVKRDARRETEGGSHHLYGIAYALDRRRRTHPGALTGPWADARAYLDLHIELARKHQQADGSFSAAMFRASEAAGSPREMVWATGHTLEWLTVAMTSGRLKERWVQRSVGSLAETLQNHPVEALSEGGWYHAAHALRRYQERVSD